jgi:hypothetical protein
MRPNVTLRKNTREEVKSKVRRRTLMRRLQDALGWACAIACFITSDMDYTGGTGWLLNLHFAI